MADDNSIMSFLQGVSSRNNGYSDGCFGGGNFGILIILFFIMFGGWNNGFGRNNNMNAENVGYDSLLAGQNQIKNQMGYDNISSEIRGVERGISDSTYALNNTITNGFRGVDKGICDSTFALNNTMTNGFAGIQNALCQGFNGINTAVSNLGFNLAEKMNTIAANNNLQLQDIKSTMQSCCCDLKTAIAAGNQKILDKMCDNENQALRDKNQDLRDQLQTATIMAQLKPTTATAA